MPCARASGGGRLLQRAEQSVAFTLGQHRRLNAVAGIEAVNALRDMAEKGQVNSDPHMLAVLRDRMQKDPNTYIRLQSAAAIQDLGPRQKF